ncbi:MAG: SDR family NAD(P)-dependent oxidoreductase, partial [Desulfobacteraceae bacterium]|nr:SDR family NAD(P)-dependent oxidoreductase [Desulfobacteraceae bacterium]
MRPHTPEDYRKLFAALNDLDIHPACILHLWSAEEFEARESSLSRAVTRGFFSLFHLSQSILETKPKDPVQLLYCYLCPPGVHQPQYSAVTAFAKTVGIETTKVVVRTVGLPDLARTADLLPEILFSRDAVSTVYRDGERRVERIGEMRWPAAEANLPLREKGVYLLTGGAGGLGGCLSEYLVGQVRARLAWIGRSPLDPAKKRQIERLEKAGGEVFFIRGDIAERKAAERMVAQAKERFGVIDGVVHAAGLIRDGYLFTKSPEDAAAVLAPKVFGTVFLDEATRSEPMDFFCLFSSISSVFGNAGQCDYAYANRFMDDYARRREAERKGGRRFGKTLSVNWPLWESGGMQVDPETRRHLSRSLGMELLREKTGLDLFPQFLAGDGSQVAVVCGDPDRLRVKLGIEMPEKGPAPETTRANRDRRLANALKADLKARISTIIRVDASEVDADEEIHTYGFDSISLTELANDINSGYRLEITPALFFEHPTINGLVDHFTNTYPKEMSSHFRIETGTPGQKTAPPRKPKRRLRPLTERASRGGEENGVAIIGMAGVMPGSEDLHRFWEHLESGTDLISQVPAERWRWEDWYGDPQEPGNRTLSKWGGFMTAVDRFDSLFFGISPREAELMDPQQRIFLELAWQVIEDAGYKPSDLAGSRTGLFVGVASRDYMDLVREHVKEIEPHASTGMSHSVLANRISYLLDLKGPSEPIDTACSSSLVAIHRAVEAIRSGSCDMAIAGGVNVMLTPTLTIGFDKAGMLSPDGRCKTFDAAADGYVRGEGAGAILLKPLDRAISDQDPVHAVIRGTAENHGGRSASLTAPNPSAQAKLLVEAYGKADIPLDTVGYIETHGTGTPIGDPIEINGLIKAFTELYARRGESLPEKELCGLGSVKTNIGHLETAAGIAGVIKTVLALQHRKLPASLHFRKLNPYIRLANTPFFVVAETRDWPLPPSDDGKARPRRAGVSSFGFGGANAHVIVEEFDDDRTKDSGTTAKAEPQVIVLSAKTEERLKAYAERIAEFFRIEKRKLKIENIAYTLQVGREAMAYRLALVADSALETSEKLTRYSAGEQGVEGLHTGRAVSVEDGQEAPFLHREAGLSPEETARRWVSGTEIDWRSYHTPPLPVRVSLPTYPFERIRHWVGDPAAGELEPPQPRKAPSDSLRGKTEAHLKEILAELLKLAVSGIDPEAPMESYGLDSILIARFNRKMESALGPLPRTLFFEHRNLRDLAGYLVQHHEQKLTDFFGMSMEAPASIPTRQRLKASTRPRSKTRSGSTAGENDIAVIGA